MLGQNKEKGLQTVGKQEVQEKSENTTPTRYYRPDTDIYETEDNLILSIDMPGVKKEDVIINLEDSTLEIEGKIDCSAYNDYEPIYAEYNIGNYFRSFKLSNAIDKSKIEAKMSDGSLYLTLPKAEKVKPRKIQIH